MDFNINTYNHINNYTNKRKFEMKKLSLAMLILATLSLQACK